MEWISGPRWVSSTNYCTLHICCHPTEHRVCSGTMPTHTHLHTCTRTHTHHTEHDCNSNKNFTNSYRLLPLPAIPINPNLIFSVSHVSFLRLLPSSFFFSPSFHPVFRSRTSIAICQRKMGLDVAQLRLVYAISPTAMLFTLFFFSILPSSPLHFASIGPPPCV